MIFSLRTFVRRRRAGFVGLALTLCLVSPVHADKVTAKKISPIDGVTGTCSVETNAKEKSLTFGCEFTNTTKKAVRFVLCAMTGLNDAKIEMLQEKDTRSLKKVPGAKSYLLKQIGGNNGKLVCALNPAGMGAINPASVYFGCKLVTLRPGEKLPVSYPTVKNFKLFTEKPNTPDKEVNFNTLKAGDFQQAYTDRVDLTNTPNKEFDPDKTCDAATGQGNFIEYDRNSIEEGVTELWSVNSESMWDPFIVYQPIAPSTVPLPCDANGDGVVDVADVQAIFAARNAVAAPGDPRDVDRDGRVTVNDARICTLRLTRQYTSYNDLPCLPTGFPANVPARPACAVRSAPPPATTVDINLFTWYSEIQPAGTRLPAVLDVVTEGDLGGVRIETMPPPGVLFDMLGGVDLYGKLSVCSSANASVCLAPSVEEGRRLDITVNITSIDPDDPSFTQTGEFIQDLNPPYVVSHSADFDAAGNLAVSVTASDATTSPIGGELWFSTDGGATWDSVAMVATPDTLDEVPTRDFVGTIGPFAVGQSVRYFVMINDTVSNVVAFGIGEVTR